MADQHLTDQSTSRLSADAQPFNFSQLAEALDEAESAAHNTHTTTDQQSQGSSSAGNASQQTQQHVSSSSATDADTAAKRAARFQELLLREKQQEGSHSSQSTQSSVSHTQPPSHPVPQPPPPSQPFTPPPQPPKPNTSQSSVPQPPKPVQPHNSIPQPSILLPPQPPPRTEQPPVLPFKPPPQPPARSPPVQAQPTDQGHTQAPIQLSLEAQMQAQALKHAQEAQAMQQLEAQLVAVRLETQQLATAVEAAQQAQPAFSSASSSASEEELTLRGPPLPPAIHRAGPDTRQPPLLPRAGDQQVGILYDNSMELHNGPEHFEQPLRIIQMYMTLEEQGLLGRCWRVPSQTASDEDLLRAHSQEHVSQIETVFSGRPEENEEDEFIHTGLDLYACKDTAAAARMATGCCVEAVKAVLQGHVQSALAIVRPPGHHAECIRAQGFCFFNNCAVAARAAIAHEGIERVLVLDWDVHHGNGIQDVLWEDPKAMYISLHRDPTNFYPYSAGFKEEVGAGPGKGFNINIPWTKRGMVDADYMAAFDLVVEPVVQSYQPDLIIVAAGYDAAKGDPLGGCRLTPQGYASMTKRLMAYAGGKVVLALEGGYNTRVTADCAAACVRVMLGESLEELAQARDKAEAFEQDNSCMMMEPKERDVPLGEAVKTLKQVAAIHAPYWPVLEEALVEARWKAHEHALRMARRLAQTQRRDLPPRRSTYTPRSRIDL